MKAATIRMNGATRAARLEGDELVVLRSTDVGELLAAEDRDRAWNDEEGTQIPVGEADFATLVPHPWKVFCVGLNYKSHIAEGDRKMPEYPTLFAKFDETLIGPYDDIVIPSVSECTDWEAELTIVIGKRVRHVSPEGALDAIAGFTVMNDISIRDYQKRTENATQGKVFEATTPVGPYLVSLDELENPFDLKVRCEVDGEVMQQARTSDLLFGPLDLVSYCSDITTLRPGDLIATGTPAGVGHVRKPPVFLRAGQLVRTIIEDVGTCENRCIAEPI